MKIFRMAWRNMWRNRWRTFISGFAIFVSSFVVALVISFETGFIGDMESNVINHLTGDIRIMNEEYVKNERVSPLQFCIADTPSAMTIVKADPYVSQVTPKTEFGISIYRSGEQIISRAVGIDFETAPLVHEVNNRITAGDVPKPESAGVLVTTELADELSLRPGDKFTALARTAINGTNGKTFTVSGIISIADSDYSGRLFFLDWRTAGTFLRMDGNALQLQVFLKNPKEENVALESITQTLNGANITDGIGAVQKYDIRPWHEVSGMYQFLQMADLIYAIIGGIFYLLACTVIFNTTMMSVLDRKKEIGTLSALGMEKSRLVSLFLLESLMISVIGSVVGLVCGAIVINTAGKIGFDVNAMGGASISGMSFSQIIYLSLSVEKYFTIFILGAIISFIASYLPSRMAAGVEPAKALADR